MAHPSPRRWRVAQRLAALAVGGALGWGALASQGARGQLASARANSPSLAKPAGSAAGGQAVYVARPGDTVWAIAVRYCHGGDPRPLEYRLEAELGGALLQPGDVLKVPPAT